MDIETIRRALRRQPFKPFTLRLTDGRSLPVPNVEFAALGARTVFVVTPDMSTYSDVDPLLIVSLDYDEGAVEREQAAPSA